MWNKTGTLKKAHLCVKTEKNIFAHSLYACNKVKTFILVCYRKIYYSLLYKPLTMNFYFHFGLLNIQLTAFCYVGYWWDLMAYCLFST